MFTKTELMFTLWPFLNLATGNTENQSNYDYIYKNLKKKDFVK